MDTKNYKPIYQRLFEHYQDRILKQEYLPGTKVDSINRIMSRHNVSRETAKIVLKKLNDEKLVVTLSGRGTFVTESKITNNSWGVIIPFFSSNMEHLLNCLHHEARERKRSFNYFLHYNNPGEETRLVGKLIQEGYEAVIIVPNYDESLTADFYHRLIPGNTTVILADNTMAGSSFKYVIQSYDLGIKRALEYMTSLNNKNILFVKNEIWKGKNLLIEHIENTLNAYSQLWSPPFNVFTTGNISEINKEYIQNKNIGGIISYNDVNAATLAGKLRNEGISIPEQVSIINYGNTELTKYFTPAITAIDCNYEELARKTAWLIELGKNCSTYEQHVIQPKLIIRKT